MTGSELFTDELGFISTHTLTWSVTGELYALNGNYGDFNSHAHVERDENNI